MNAHETWHDFYTWILPQKESLKKEDWTYLRKTNSDMKMKRKVGFARLNKIFQAFAPGRYEFGGYWSLK